MRTKEQELKRLRLLKFRGCGITCPNCNTSGKFGTISRWEEDNKEYLICGHCSTITELGESDDENIKQKHKVYKVVK